MTPGETIRAFAPATVANLGPGFDLLGLALEGLGDLVTARIVPGRGSRLVAIRGEGSGALASDPASNTATIAAEGVLGHVGREVGVELELEKGIPIGSGLGSSAASAAAAALAVNRLLGNPLRKIELIGPCLEAEARVSGHHADNVAPALLGGLILVRALEPLDIIRLPIPAGLFLSVATPRFELSTRAARSVLREEVTLSEVVLHGGNLAGLICALHSGDLGLLSRCLEDHLVTPARLPLIPGGLEAIEAARDAGALSSSISGAGPSIFALCHSKRIAQEAAAAMVDGFQRRGHEAGSIVSPADCAGARLL